ncbi:MAG: DUF423 domain-containing protein [Alteromonadaceae bacterium]|nr:DUF423 domain-containing protein [Alteromonadaceae bacterium]
MKLFLVSAGVLAGLSVVLGAFAAHGLKNKIPENLLNAFQTGVDYQLFHSLAIILIVILAKQYPNNMWASSAGALLAGIVLFSGSLYGLALTSWKWLGPITPIGGVAFIVGWILFVLAAYKSVEI